MKHITMILTVMTLSVIMLSCNGNSSQQKNDKQENNEAKKAVPNKQVLSGDYICTAHWNDALVGSTKMTFDNDSVSLAGVAKTTYHIKGDSLFVDMHQYEMGFVIKGNTLTTSGSAGKVSYKKK